MSYDFRNTYRKNKDTYIEDRGYQFTVSKGDKGFSDINNKFGSLLKVGQTAMRSQTQDGEEDWDIVEGCPFIEAETELLFKKLREKRDMFLNKTDFLLMPDYQLSEENQERVRVYRQSLRDMPSQEGAPWDGGGSKTPWPELLLTR